MANYRVRERLGFFLHMQAPPAASPSHAAGTRRRLRLRERPSLLPPVVHGPGGQWARSHIHPCPSPSTCRVLSSQSRQEVELADTGLSLLGGGAGIFLGLSRETLDSKSSAGAVGKTKKRPSGKSSAVHAQNARSVARTAVAPPWCRRRPPAAHLVSPCFLAAAGGSACN